MSFNGDFNNVSIQFKGSALTVALKNWEVLALVTILNFMYAMKVASSLCYPLHGDDNEDDKNGQFWLYKR